MPGTLYWRLGEVETRYNRIQRGADTNEYGSMKYNYDYAQLLVYLRPSWFNYSKVKTDGSDIVFYYKDENDEWQLATFYEWIWNYGGISTYILKLPNAQYTRNIPLAIEYGKTYVPPSGHIRPTGRVTNIESIVEFWDDFDSFDSSEWYTPDDYSMGGSKIRLKTREYHNLISNPKFYTKKKWHNVKYGFYFKANFQSNHIIEDRLNPCGSGINTIDWHTPAGFYYDIDETTSVVQDRAGYKGFIYGRYGYLYYEGKKKWSCFPNPPFLIDWTDIYRHNIGDNTYRGMVYSMSEDRKSWFHRDQVETLAFDQYYVAGDDSNGIDKIYSWYVSHFEDRDYDRGIFPYTYNGDLTVDEGYPMGGIGTGNRRIYIKERESSFGFFGSERGNVEIDWFMIMTNQHYWGAVVFDPEVEPSIDITEPDADICTLLPPVRVEAYNWLGHTELDTDVAILTDHDELCIDWINQRMTPGTLSPYVTYAVWLYKLVEPDDFLARGNFKVTATVRNKFGLEMSKEEGFVINNCVAHYNITELIRDFEELTGTVKFDVENETEERINMRHLLQKINENNTLIPMEITRAENTDASRDLPFHDGYILGLRTTTVAKRNYEFDFRFAQEELYEKLNKKDIEVDSEVIIYNFLGTAWNVTPYVKTYELDRTIELGARELHVELSLESPLSPFFTGGEPYPFYGNKIEIYQKIRFEDNPYAPQPIRTYKKYTGYIIEASASKLAVHIVAHDKMKNFSYHTHEDYHFEPDKVKVEEYLQTFDGTKFRSSHSVWAKYPPPLIYLGKKRLKPGEYLVDYLRGIVYVFRNTIVSGDVAETVIDANDVADRKTFHTPFNIDYSADPKVIHIFREKTEYSCIGGIGKQEVWVERFEEIDRDDYTIDFKNDNIVLHSPIPVDTDTVADHKLHISSRDVKNVRAVYYYEEEGTNEVEDLIEFLALECGFTTDELRGTTVETIVKKDKNVLYTSKNNISSLTSVKVNGVPTGQTEVDLKNGRIEIDYTLNDIEIPFDPMVSVRHVSSSSAVTVERDTSDFYYAEASVKASLMNIGDWIEWDYDREYFRKSVGKYSQMGIYLKADKACEVAIITYDKTQGQSAKTTQVGSEWIQIPLGVLGTVDREEIYKLRINLTDGSNVTLHVDYLHTMEDVVTVDYKYHSIQNTGITANEVWYLTEEVETFNDILEELLEIVDPSYVLYVDEEGILRGEFKKVATYVMQGQVLKNNFVDAREFAGFFYLPDMYLRMLRRANTAVSDEEIYTAVQVLGLLADKYNVALFSKVYDRCTWANGKAYGVKGRHSIKDYINYIPPDIPQVFVRKLQNQAPVGFKGTACVDGDVWSGIWWYKESEDPDARPPLDAVQLEVVLPEAVLWEEIHICVGSYKGKVIREEMFIEVEDEVGNKWYPSGEKPNKQNGNTGTWLTWDNEFNKNKKIKKIWVYCSEPWHWVTSETVTNSGKK